MKYPNTFFIADTHFGHKATVEKFLRPDGSKLRPWSDVDVMNQDMIARWNATVGVDDKVIFAGDFAMNRRYAEIASQLHGHKILVAGNHDVSLIADLAPHFRKICGTYEVHDWIVSHMPLREENFRERWSVNVHGHLHAQDIDNGSYFCVSVENIDFTPISLPELQARIAEKQTRHPCNTEFQRDQRYSR